MIEFEGFAQHENGAEPEDPVQGFAVRISCDDDDREIGMALAQRSIDLVAPHVREMKVEKHQVEVSAGAFFEGFSSGTDNDLIEAGAGKELPEDALESRVVVDCEDEGGRGVPGVAQNVAVEKTAFDAPAAADLDGGEFAALEEVIDSGEGDSQVGGGFLDGQEFWQGIGHERGRGRRATGEIGTGV